MIDPEKQVKLAAKLPKKAPANGLETVYAALRRHGTAVIVAQVTAPTREEHLGGIVIPKMEIEWVEGLSPSSAGSQDVSLAKIGADLLEVARAERLGDGDGVLVDRETILEALYERIGEMIGKVSDGDDQGD
jgi:hypothetical protein